MKRCPICNRVETDDALAFCRADGTALISDSSALSGEAGTAKLGSAATEIETSILPHTTDSIINRASAPTTVLPAQPTPGASQALSKPKRRKEIVAMAGVIAVALIACAYIFWPRGKNAAPIGELESESAHRYVPSAGLAVVFAALGEKDKAFAWLEKDVTERTPRPPLFSVNPVFDDLRDDPRFQDLLHQIAAKID
jgi:hypothetical protein